MEVDERSCPLTRDELVAVLQAENVLARRYFWPGVHRMERYRSLQPNAAMLLPHTERVAARVLILPTGQAVDAAAVETIAGVMHTAITRAEEIRAAIVAAPQGR